jgi:hypothetical protein
MLGQQRVNKHVHDCFVPATNQHAKYYGTVDSHSEAKFKDMIDISKAATVWVPKEAASLSRAEALRRIDLLRVYRRAIDTETIEAVKEEWVTYRQLIDAGAYDAVINAVIGANAEGADGEGAPAEENAEPRDEDVCKAIMTFFKNHEKKVPAFAKVAKLLAVIPTSSAAAERVFSLLRRMFDDTQQSTLEDKLELALLLKYNDRNM